MATMYNRTICSCWIFILVVTFETMRHGCLEGMQRLDRRDFGPKPKGTIKTIEVPEDGDLVDCVDIYKQPAFDDPLTKHIKMEMEPSSEFRSVFKKTNNSSRILFQNWQKYGECSKGTIPIRRPKNKTIGTTYRKNPRNAPPKANYEYAVAKQQPQRSRYYHGAGADFNVWNPHVEGFKEHSIAQLWVTSGSDPDETLNTVETGWLVSPYLFDDSKTRLFTYWTRDSYGSTGCYNLECGFRQASNKICVGCALNISVYGRKATEQYISVIRDFITGNWWLDVGAEQLGYFPRDIFTTLGDGANRVEFGGEIINNKKDGEHTTTEMGSGHFSTEGRKKASYVRKIKIVNQLHETIAPNLTLFATDSDCYDIQLRSPTELDGTMFYYGGPGTFGKCP